MHLRSSTLATLASSIALVVAMRAPEAVAEPAVRPNIVVIMTDDQRLDTLRYMPKTLELIAAEGVTFANAFASFPVCSPSRATFLTGQYAHNHGVLGNALPSGGYSKLDSSNTLPVWLRKTGYRTAFIGKYLNHYGKDDPLEIPAGWDNWQGMLDYRYYGFRLNDNGTLLTFGGSENEYRTDVEAARADAIIRHHAGNNSGRPLFLYVATQAPHAGRNSDAVRDDPAFAHLTHPFGSRAMRHFGRFENEPFPKSRAFNEKSMKDKPAHMYTIDPLSTEATYGIDAHYRAKLELLQAVDDLVETVITALSDTGMLENTLVVYTSDNGFFHGEHRIVTAKYFPYDEALRVPLLMRGPGFPAGVTAAQFVTNIDVAPTIVELSGTTPGRVMDGRSLLRLANDPASGRGRVILLEATHTGLGNGEPIRGRKVDYRGVRDERYQYVEYGSGDRELYFMVSDTAQVNNRIDDPKLAGVQSRMQEQLRKQQTCRGVGCSQGSP